MEKCVKIIFLVKLYCGLYLYKLTTHDNHSPFHIGFSTSSLLNTEFWIPYIDIHVLKPLKCRPIGLFLGVMVGFPFQQNLLPANVRVWIIRVHWSSHSPCCYIFSFPFPSLYLTFSGIIVFNMSSLKILLLFIVFLMFWLFILFFIIYYYY